jgi:hypothetical protein
MVLGGWIVAGDAIKSISDPPDAVANLPGKINIFVVATEPLTQGLR